MPKDTKLYDLLNVAPNASESDIRKVGFFIVQRWFNKLLPTLKYMQFYYDLFR